MRYVARCRSALFRNDYVWKVDRYFSRAIFPYDFSINITTGFILYKYCYGPKIRQIGTTKRIPYNCDDVDRADVVIGVLFDEIAKNASTRMVLNITGTKHSFILSKDLLYACVRPLSSRCRPIGHTCTL